MGRQESELEELAQELLNNTSIEANLVTFTEPAHVLNTSRGFHC